MAPAISDHSTSLIKTSVPNKHDLVETDSTVARILGKISVEPYTVTVPSEFKYHPQKIRYDFRQSHWGASDRHLEYCSFLYRDTTLDNSLLRLEAQDSSMGASLHSTPLPETNPSTPSLGPKKKISLADYKKLSKEKERAPSPATSHPVPQGSHAAPAPALEAAPKPATSDPVAPSSPGDTSKNDKSGNDLASPFTERPAKAAPSTEAQVTQKQAHSPPPAENQETSTSKSAVSPGTSHPNNLRNAAAIQKHVPEIRVETSDSPLPDHLSPLQAWIDDPSPISLQLAAVLKTGDKRSHEVYLELPSDHAIESAKRIRLTDSDKGQKHASDGEHASSTAKMRPSKRTSGDVEDAPNQDRVKRVKANTAVAERPRTPPARLDSGRSAVLSTPTSSLKQSTDGTSKVETPSGHAGTPASVSSSGNSSQKWKQELVRLEAVGKRLKRESQASAGANPREKGSKDHSTKLSVVQGVESILCFMTAFCANDQIKPTHPSWRSLAALIDEVAKRAEGYPHLQGLCFLLRWACCQRSVSILNNTKLDDITDLDKAKEHLVAVQTYVQRAEKFAKQANKLLARAVLASTYPQAYKTSEAIPLALAPPMPVIRTAMALLREWSAQERLRWTPSFDEGECSKL